MRCGREVAGTLAKCPSCGSCLLVDVVVEERVDDGRAAYLAARDIDTIAAGAFSYEAVRRALVHAPGPVVSHCTRDLANLVAGVLRRHGITFLVVPLRRPRWRLLGAGPTAGSGGALEVMTERLRGLPTSTWIVAAAVVALALLALLLPDPGEVAGPAAARPPAVGDGPLLSSREVIFTALASSARVEVDGGSRIGFFVESGRLVTTAVGLADGHPAVAIELADGRRLAGRVERRDPWLDLAVVEVPDGDSPVLALGDATLLAAGEPVAVVTAAGPSLAVSQGVVSQPSRFLMGLALVKIDATISPDSGGGAVVDRSGRVVAVVSTTVAGLSEPGLTLPVNYLSGGTEPLVERPADDARRRRFSALEVTARQRERDELAAIQSSAAAPSLVAADSTGPGRVRALVIRYATTRPMPEELSFEVLRDGGRLCTAVGRASGWQAATGSSVPVDRHRFVRWLTRNSLPGQLYGAEVTIEGHTCPATLAGADLLLEGGNPSSDRTVIR